MATSFYTTGNTNFIANFKAALMAKNLISTLHFENAEYLVFTSPISSKPFKVQFMNNWDTGIYFWIGDSYSSGADLVNPVMILESVTAPEFSLKAIDFFVDVDKFIILWQPNDGQANGLVYAGKLDNGEALVFGLGGYNSTNNRARRLSDNATLVPIFITTNGTGMKDASGNIFTFPLIFSDSTGLVLMNGINPAKLEGISLSTYIGCGKQNVYNGAGYYLTPSIMYMGTNQNLQVSLVIPYTS